MSQKLKQNLYRVGAPILAGGITLLGAMAAHAQSDPFDLSGKISDVASTTGTYFGIMITNFWPFALGGVILLGVVGFGWFIIQKFFHH